MATSEHWNTRDKVEAAADTLLAENDDLTLETITAYQVAKSLGARANSTFHVNFQHWKERKLAERSGVVHRPSTEAMAPLADAGQRFLADFMARASSLIGETIGAFDRAANLKLVEAHHAVRSGVDERNGLIGDLSATEAERDEAFGRIRQLEHDIALAKANEQQLLGRIAQMMEDRDQPRGRTAKKTPPPVEIDPDEQMPLL
jgi:hypothetical protein